MYILCGDMNIRPLVWYILSIHCAARRASHVSTAEGSKFVGPESTKNVATIQGTPKVPSLEYATVNVWPYLTSSAREVVEARAHCNS